MTNTAQCRRNRNHLSQPCVVGKAGICRWYSKLAAHLFACLALLLLVAPAMAANDATVYSQTIPVTMTAGVTYSVSVTMKNTGTAAWASTGKYSFSLVSGNGWTAAPIAVTTPVAVNGTRAFAMKVTAPSTPGTYSLQFSMEQQGVGRFGALPGATVQVEPRFNSAEISSVTTVTSVDAKATKTVYFYVENTGNVPWAGGEYSLTTVNSPVKWLSSAYTTTSGVPVGTKVYRSVTITGPSELSYQDLQFQVKDVAGNLIGEPSVSQRVAVLGPAPALTIQSPNPDQPYILDANVVDVPVKAIATASGVAAVKKVALIHTYVSGDTTEQDTVATADGSTLDQVLPMYGSYRTGLTVRATDTFGKVTSVALKPLLLSDSSSTLSNTVPSSMVPELEYDVSITLTNSGTTTWYAGKVELYNTSTTTSWGIETMPLTSDIAPGKAGTFTGRLTAPAAGARSFSWKLREKTRSPFGAVVLKTITIARPLPVVKMTEPAASTSIDVPPGGTALVRVQGTATAGTAATMKRIDLLDGSSIIAAQLGTSFDQTVQLEAGSHSLKLRAVDNWDIQASTAAVVVSVKANGASYSSQTVPATMQVGKTYTPTITMVNSGTKPWGPVSTTITVPYELAAQNPAGNTTWGVASVPVTATTSANTSRTFSVPVTAPSKPGTYNFQWQMRQGTNGWFGALSKNVEVVVKPLAPTVEALAAPVTGDKLIATGGKATVRLRGAASAGADAAIAKLEVLDGTTIIATADGAAIDTEVQLATGSHSMKLRATDNFDQVVSGPVTAVSILTNAATYSSRSVTSPMVGGQTYQVTVAMRNSGTATWTTEDNYVLSQVPGTATWRTANVPLPGPIAPNTVATFVFDVTAPEDPATYPFQWQMQREGFELFGAKSTVQNVVVTGVPPQVTLTGPIAGASFVAANDYAAVPVKGSAQPTGSATISKMDVIEGTTVIDTSTGAIFDKAVQLAPGTHALKLRATDSRGAVTLSNETSVTVLRNGATFVSQTIPTEMYKGERHRVTVTMKNTGDTPWAPVTAGRGMALAAEDSTGWRADGRVPLANAVAPGEQATFDFEVMAPAGTGTYGMQWRMIEEGRESFGASTERVLVSVVTPPVPKVQLSATPTNVRVAPGASASIRLAASATEAKGIVAKLEVFRGTTTTYDAAPLKTLSGSTETLALDEQFAVPRGSYRYKVRATDGAGRTGESDPVIVNVTDSAVLGSITGVRTVDEELQLVGWLCRDGSTEALGYRVYANAPPSLGGIEVGQGSANVSTEPGDGPVRAQCHTPATSHHFVFDLRTIVTQNPGAALYVVGRAANGEELVLPCADNSCRLPEGMRIGLTSPSAQNTDHFRFPAPAFVRAVVSGSNGEPDEVSFNIDGEWLVGVSEGNGAYSVTKAGMPVSPAPYAVSARVRQGNTTVITEERLLYIDSGTQHGQLSIPSGTQLALGQTVQMSVGFNETQQSGNTVMFFIDKAVAQRQLLLARSAAAVSQGAVSGAATFDGIRWIYSWVPGELGQYSIVAKLFDGSGGLLAQTDPVTVTVGNSDSAPPAAVTIPSGILPDAAAPAGGSLPGDLAVDNSGSAIYEIPLVVPPGSAGFQPKLALSYNSAVGNGLLGVGWSLKGLSSIDRCGKTIAQDGFNGRISFANSDRLCMDGQRLMLVNVAATDDSYWADDAEYRTEINSMARIKAQGSGAARTFKVEYRDGTVGLFGSGSGFVQPIIQPVNSGVTAPQPKEKNGAQSWAISSIADRAGNFVRFSYEQDKLSGEHLPKLIVYGGVGLAAHAAVQFTYEGRDDSWKRYIDETRNDLRSRLSNVKTYVGDEVEANLASATLVQDYVLKYEKSPTSGRSLLLSVQSSGYNGGPAVSLPATEFTWGKPDPAKSVGFESHGIWENAPVLMTHMPTSPFYSAAHPEFFAFADFDRDGLDDVLEMRVASPGPGSNSLYPTTNLWNPIEGGTQRSSYRYFHNTGSGFSVHTYRLSTGNAFAVLDSGDFDGDGLPDLLVASGTETKICMSPLKSAAAIPNEIVFTCGSLPAYGQNREGSGPLVVDVRGEGRSAHYGRGNNNGVYPNLCIQSACELDMGAPVQTLGSHAADGSTQYARSGYVSMNKQVDFGGSGKPYGVGWTKVAYTKYVFDGDLPQYHPTFLNMQPQVVVTSYRKPGEPDSGKIAAFAYRGYPTPPDPSADKPDQYPKVEPPYKFDTHVSEGSVYGDLNGSGYNSLAFGFLELAYDHSSIPVLPSYKSAEFTLCLSTGRALDCGVRQKYSGKDYRSILSVGNFVGDGAPALLVGTMTYPSNDGPLLSGDLEVCRVMGDDTTGGTGADDANLVCTPWPGVRKPVYFGDQMYIMDLLGTGRPQLVYHHGGKAIDGAYVEDGRWEVFAPKDIAVDGQALDRIVSVKNGKGAVASVEYVDGIPSGIVTMSAQSQLSYPQQPLRQPGKLVRRLRVNSGAGGSVAKTYAYQDNGVDVAGRGALGFRRVTVTDEQYRIDTVTEFAQNWPFIGMPLSVSRIVNGCHLEDSRYDLGLADIAVSASGLTVFPYVSKASTVYRDLGTNGQCVEMGDGSVITKLEDGWGNVTSKASVRSGDGKSFGETVISKYENNDADWLIAHPLTVETTRSDSASGTVKRSASATFHPVNGLQMTRTIEPEDALYRSYMEFERDKFGLIRRQKESWADPACAKTGWPIVPCGGSKSRSSSTQYDAKGRYPSSMISALNALTKYAYDPGTGAEVRVTDPNGLVTERRVDPFSRIISETRPDATEVRSKVAQCDAKCPAGAATVTVVETFNKGQPSAVPVLEYQDAVGHVVRTLTVGFGGGTIVTDTEYNDRGLPYKAFHPRFATAQAVLAAQYTYDIFDRLKVISKPDEQGVLGETKTSYLGFDRETKNPKGQLRAEHYDAAGQLQSVTDHLKGITAFAYEPFGALSKTTDPNGNVSVVEYDRLGRRTALVDPDLGRIEYLVNPLGQVYAQISPNQREAGTFTAFGYDVLGRMMARYEADLVSHWDYDTAPYGWGKLARAYTGQLSKMDYLRLYTYDTLGRLVSTEQWLSDAIYTDSIRYDNWGRVATQEYRRDGDAAKKYTYRYNSLGYQSGIARGDLTLSSIIEQDAAHRTTKAQLGNGLVQLTAYNGYTGRLSRGAAMSGQVDVVSDDYEYDALGNVSKRTQYSLVNGTKSGFMEEFEYDNLNRLHRASSNGVDSLFTYDAAGNLDSKSNVGTYEYGPQGEGKARPHAVLSITGGLASLSYSYDGNGNLQSGGGRRICWTSFDMPATIAKGGTDAKCQTGSKVTFVYGSEHQRVRQFRSNGDVIYAGAQEVEGANGQVTVKTYWPGGLGVEIDRIGSGGTELYWTYKDRLGSPIAMLSASGAVAEPLEYDAWGKRRSTDNHASVPDSLDGKLDNRGFTGHEMLDQLDLVHMNGRVYDPLLGKFLSADPLIQDPANGQGYNRYSYVLNNPTNLTDPTGFYSCGTTKAEQDQCTSSDRESRANERKERSGWLVVYSVDQKSNSEAGVQVKDGKNRSANTAPNGGLLTQLKDGYTGDNRSVMWSETGAEQVGRYTHNIVDFGINLLPGSSLPEVGEQAGQGNYGAAAIALGTELLGPWGKEARAINAAEKISAGATRFVDGVKVVDRKTGQVLEGAADLGPTIDRINAGGTHAHVNDGSIFKNRGGVLPQKPGGYYTEYVVPTPGFSGAGPQRIVVGKGGEAYYTPNHYGSFVPLNK